MHKIKTSFPTKKMKSPPIFGNPSKIKGLGGHDVKAPGTKPEKKKNKSFAKAIIGKD